MRSVILIIMRLKIRLKMLLKKKEKRLSEYAQISVRGLSKQGLTPSLPMAQWPIRGRNGVLVWSHGSQQNSSALYLRENAPTKGLQDKPWHTHADPGLADSVHRQSGLGGDTHSCWHEAQATGCAIGTVCGLTLSACSRPGRNAPRLALEKH